MIKTIRDDVIKLESFVAAAFKYDEELEIIYNSGGYCFIAQVKNKYGENKGKKIIYDMEKNKLIGTEYYSNYKYIYITQNALKYIANKNNTEEEVIKKQKNLNKFPTEKTLLSSAIKYELEKNHLSIWSRQCYINMLEEKIRELFNYCNVSKEQIIKEYNQYKIESKKIIKYTKVIKELTLHTNKQLNSLLEDVLNKYEEKINNYEKLIEKASSEEQHIEQKTKKGINLYDISKIAIIPEDKQTVKMYLIDCGSIKQIDKYINHIKDYEQEINITFKILKIIYISYSKERYEKFQNRLEKYKKNNSTNKTIELKDINYCYYLKEIIEGSTYDIENIKPKDKEAFEKIKEELNQ